MRRRATTKLWAGERREQSSVYFISVRRGSLRTIDNEDVDRAFLRVQLEPEPLLQGSEY
jgi:hypothetical protein